METSTRIRIMLIVPMLDQGGLERICALTAQLLKTKYEVHLVVFNTEGMIYDVSGVHLIDLHLGAVPGKFGKIINVYKRVAQVKKLKKELDIQISYSFGQTANMVNVLSKYHDKTWAGIRGYGALDNYRQMQFVCKRADRMVSCTKVMEQEIGRSYPVKNSATLYNPCNLDEINVLSREKIDEKIEAFLQKTGPTIVSMGRAHDVKGFWHLIKAVKLVKNKVPHVKLMIIGDGDYSAYQKLAQELGIAEQVLFTGVQMNPFALLAKADVYALTSDSEGFPNALIEAMAVGLPCVSVNCKTGPAEILQNDYQQCAAQDKVYHADYGILTPVFYGGKNLDASMISQEEEIFAGELVELLLNQELMTSYRNKALYRANQFGVDAYVREIDRLIVQELEWPEVENVGQQE